MKKLEDLMWDPTFQKAHGISGILLDILDGTLRFHPAWSLFTIHVELERCMVAAWLSSGDVTEEDSEALWERLAQMCQEAEARLEEYEAAMQEA